MEAFLKFIDNWGVRIMTFLVLIIFLKTCSTNSRIEKVQDKIESTNSRIDSLQTQIKKEIKIEGLKSEKRMIQATDRKMMDVNRQSEIDKEISIIERQ